MPSRVEAAAILDVSERTLRRYMQEFPEFFNGGRDLTATDLALLRIIHGGKQNGRDTGLDIRERLAECVRAAGTPPTPPAGSVQKMPETQAQGKVATGQTETLTRDDLLRVLQPLVKVIQDLQVEVAGLRRQTSAQPLQVVPKVRTLAIEQRPARTLPWWRRLWLELVDPARLRVNVERSWADVS